MNPVWLSSAESGGSQITVHVQPGAACDELAGSHGDALKIRIRARAVEGAANAALLDLVADRLQVPRREVSLLRGAKSRRKTLWVPLQPAQVLSRLGT